MSAWTCRCQSAGKAAAKIVPLRSRTPCWNGPGADSEEKREPVSDIDTAVVDGLKVLDPNGRLEKLPRQFPTRGIRRMGFNKRKMEAERKALRAGCGNLHRTISGVSA